MGNSLYVAKQLVETRISITQAVRDEEKVYTAERQTGNQTIQEESITEYLTLNTGAKMPLEAFIRI